MKMSKLMTDEEKIIKIKAEHKQLLEMVKENIKKKFQDEKLPLVDEVYEKDIKFREIKTKADDLRAERNSVSAQIGEFVRNKEMDKVDGAKKRVNEINDEIANIEKEEETLQQEIKERMMVIQTKY